MSKHCMVDLETLATTADAVILSLGAVVFDENGTVFNTFYRVLNTDSQPDRVVSHDTLMWWLKQSDGARQALTNDKAHDLPSTLRLLAQQLPAGVKMWSCGADFDLPMLQHAYAQCGMPVPWKFWDNRCYRTVKAIHRDVLASERAGTYHNALDDAKHQMQHLLAIHRAVGGIL